jgi:phosphopantothenoylcysteine decarboxylase/phosphopantothenate--cysteine ligase|tara:strand:+ start:510 stop:1727 length:1218 start_codon:yes stop_codon:yes gene_type:complete
MTSLTNKRILLGVTGGIAAYKSAELIRRLQDAGAEVRVVMTKAATEFITPLTLQALSGNPVYQEMLDADAEAAMGHIQLARWADLILVAPATADFIAKLANGQGNDLLTTLCLACTSPIAVAPAMNQAMWTNQVTQENQDRLLQKGVKFFGPGEGLQACGETGPGRLLEPMQLVDLAAAVFPSSILSGKQIVITAGPTREAIDPVRYVSNHSSGKQGFALAEAAVEAGASVTLIAGPTHLQTPDRVQRIDVISAEDMFSAVLAEAKNCDIYIGVAAVADFRPVHQVEQKIKKGGGSNQTLSIELIENPDIIATVAELDPGPYTVGFAAETDNLIEYAKAKLISKRLDMIIANDVSDSSIGFDSDENSTTVIWDSEQQEIPQMSKQNVARKVIELIAARQKTRLTT